MIWLLCLGSFSIKYTPTSFQAKAQPRPQGPHSPWAALWNSKNESPKASGPMGPHEETHGALAFVLSELTPAGRAHAEFVSSRALPMSIGALRKPSETLGYPGGALWYPGRP